MQVIRRIIAGTFLLSSCCVKLYSQRIDHTAAFRKIDNTRYFRFHYDNDFFTKTDYYYSQGITFEYVAPSLLRFFPQKILLHPRNSHFQPGISIQLFGYTPTSIKSDAILYGDRPYAAAISFKTWLSATDTIRQQRLSSAINAGVIGPAGLGKDIQTTIHRWLNNKLPRGWQQQIQNDVLLNYHVNFEKKLFHIPGLLIGAMAEARLGTLENKMGMGFQFMTGRFNNPFTVTNTRKKMQYYLYAQTRGNIIGYDASLQGGIFNRSSPYTIAARDIRRAVFQADAGIILNFRKLFLSYTQSYITPEFRTGKYHRWGGVSFGVGL